MDKRENIIKEFEAGIQDFSPADTSDERFKEVCNAVLYLLKAHEPAEPAERPIGWRCGHCNSRIEGYANFCQNCGREIKWK